MNISQLSFFPEPETKERKYKRDRAGRFASEEQLELEEAKREAVHYRLLYEAEKRKLTPVLKRLVLAERELNELKKKHEEANAI